MSTPKSAGREPGRRPNVVMIMADQLRADHLGFGGNSVVRTPNLDAIAASGVRFDRAYVANPVCMPNRASILTSRMPSAHGTRYNGIPLDHDAETFVRRLRCDGYRTGLIGKAHLQNIGNNREVAEKFQAGGPPRDGVRRDWPAGWDAYEDVDRHRKEWVQMPADYYGFGHVEVAIDHSDYSGGHYEQWLREKGYDPDRRGERASSEVSESWRQVYRPEMPEELYPTAWVAERTSAFISDAAAANEPFFVQASFPDPHHPFTPPGRYYDMYDPADIPPPETFEADHSKSMPHLRGWSAHRGKQAGKMSPFSPTEAQFREAAAKEYGAITFIDDAVGRIVTAVAEAGQLDNTVFVISSDHGDMFGDQGIMLKLAMHYEGPTRVPLVIAGPGVPAGARDAFASSIDIAPTLLELTGVEGYAGMQGASLVPVLADASTSVRQEVYIEEDEMFDPINAETPLMMRTLITSEGRITVYRGTEDGEFFLHGDDPQEIHNRWHDPAVAERRADHLLRLVHAQIRHTDTSRRPTAMA